MKGNQKLAELYRKKLIMNGKILGDLKKFCCPVFRFDPVFWLILFFAICHAQYTIIHHYTSYDTTPSGLSVK